MSRGAVKTSSGRAAPDYPALAQDVEPVEEQRHQVDAVGRHDDGDAALPVQPHEKAHHLVFPHGVEPGGRLVEQQDLVAHGEKPGDADALLLPEAERVDGLIEIAPHVDVGERLAHPGGDLFLREPHVERAEGHVLRDGGREELVVGVLEDEADLAVDLLWRQLPDIGPIEHDAAS